MKQDGFFCVVSPLDMWEPLLSYFSSHPDVEKQVRYEAYIVLLILLLIYGCCFPPIFVKPSVVRNENYLLAINYSNPKKNRLQ